MLILEAIKNIAIFFIACLLNKQILSQVLAVI